MSLLITLCTFIPLLTALVIVFIPAKQKALIKWVGLIGASLAFIVAIQAVREFNDPENKRLNEIATTRSNDLYNDLEPAEQAHVDAASKHVLGEFGEGDDPAVCKAAYEMVKEDPTFRTIMDLRLAAMAPAAKHIRNVEYADWIPVFGIHYFMGLDGLSLPLFFLTALLGVLCLVYSWNIDKGTKGYFALFLILETGLLGVFCALDFFLFYVFWEIVLLPMYFLIGIWGGPRRIYAAIKFFIYTLVGSVLMLVAMLALFFQMEPNSFNMIAQMQVIPGLPLQFQFWVFGLLMIGFIIKVPSVPFHTWLPDAHVEAPTAVSVILAGVLLKMGGYGLFRINYSILPDAAMAKFYVTVFIVLGVVSMLYGALCAMAQKDFKSLVAYSSISHMGYVLLGMVAVTAAGMQGAAMQMFAHGVSSAMLFLLVGVIYERAHHRDLAGFGGIGLQMPYYAGMATIGFFASLGLPGLCGFIGEALVFLGAFNSNVFGRIVVYIAVPTVVLTAAYILWTIQRVFLGPIKNEKYKTFKDMSFREWFALTPLAILAILVGVWPRAVLDIMNDSLNTIVDIVEKAI